MAEKLNQARKEKLMIPCTAYDTKLYDRDHLAQAPDAERIAWRFHGAFEKPTGGWPGW